MPFPLCPPPLTDTGAYTNPRELQRWLDVNPVSKLNRPQKYITLPAFDQGNSTWNGYSDIVAAFNCEAPNNFSLQGLAKDIPSTINYTLTISYRVGGTVTRYMLWDAAGSNMNQNITPYAGQPMLKNFRFEVWNTSQGIASQAEAINIFTSVLSKVDWRYGSDAVLKACDSETTNLSVSNSTNTTPINIPSITQKLDPSVGVTKTGPFLNTWTDSLLGMVMTADFGTVIANVNQPFHFTSTGKITFTSGGALDYYPNGCFAMLLNMTPGYKSATVLQTDTGVALTFDNTTKLFTCFGKASNYPIPANASNFWYAIIMESTTGKWYMFNAKTGEILDIIQGTAPAFAYHYYSLIVNSNAAGGFISDMALYEMLMYYDTGFSAALNVVDYFNQKYFNNSVTHFDIPFKFPANAVSTTN